MIRWMRRPSAPIAMSTATFSSNCSAEPRPSVQLAYAIDRPMSAAAGMDAGVGDERISEEFGQVSRADHAYMKSHGRSRQPPRRFSAVT